MSPDVIQARFRAQDGLLDPVGISRGLLALSGAEVITDCRVTGLRSGRPAAIGRDVPGHDRLRSGLTACGPLSGVVARAANVKLPIRLVRRQRLSVGNVPEVPAGAPMTIDEDTAAHWRPAPGGALALWPEPDEPAGDPLEQVPADPAFAIRAAGSLQPHLAGPGGAVLGDVWRGGSATWTSRRGSTPSLPTSAP